MFFPNIVKGLTYENVDQNTFQYNINNFYLDGNHIVMNGWAVTNGHQHLTGNDTHEYSLVLTDRTTNISKTYISTLKNVNKTNLMKTHEYTVVCSSYYSSSKCYYLYTMVGFEFRIPLSDLNGDAEYNLKLRIYEKQVNRAMQISIYALGIDNTYEKDGIRYQLYSDINKTSVTLQSTYLVVRSGPGQNYAQKTTNFWCSYNGYDLYWYPLGTFTNIIGTGRTNGNSIDSELWLNLGYDNGWCVDGKARAVNESSLNGWAPWVFMIGNGTPAVIKTTTLNTISIDELRTYTAKKNTQTKALITLKSSLNQTVVIKAYHNNNLVYNENKTFNGTKTFRIDYVIPSDGIFRVEVITPYKTYNISSKIYISEEKTYEINSDTSEIITIDTPILVVTDKTGKITEYKEKIMLSAIPYKFDLSQGRGISGITSAISYWYPLEEFSLNSDYSVYALYPSQEDTLNYKIVDGKVKVTLEKDGIIRKSNYDISYFHHPNILLSVIKGNLYKDSLDGYEYYNGGGIWYPSWNDDLGTYEYQYIGTNLGINKITIIRNLTYTINSTMFGSETGEFKIKRIETPNNLNVIYRKTFTYDELQRYLKEI
ncbi:MAG: hypothetical protein GX265_01515 [Mollicutes bacterium]|nr:hypothetical protein [Mollicutes bacterium]